MKRNLYEVSLTNCILNYLVIYEHIISTTLDAVNTAMGTSTFHSP